MIIKLFEDKGKEEEQQLAVASAIADAVSAEFDASVRLLVAEQRRDIESLKTALIDQIAAKLTPVVSKQVAELLSVLSRPVAEMPASVSAIFYRGILARKGMAGDPVICDACGSVFSNNGDSCDNCRKRKNAMGPGSFPSLG